MSSPRLNPSVLVCPGDDGLLAYDPVSDRVHRLNPVASLICELCDGLRTLDEIERLVAPVLPEGEGEQVRRFVEQGLEAGLLLTGVAQTPPSDAAALAKRLRDADKFEAAFICQYHAAEQDPENPALWASLGELGHILGRRGQAREAYERYLALRPYDAEIRHLLIALRDEPAPPQAGRDAIQQLYERFSTFYESNMLDELDYQAPQRLAALVSELAGECRDLRALELGCGTGLAGAEIRPRCAHLTGVDLSSHMLALARERGTYDALEEAEIGDWLERCERRFDLVLACDSLIYFGELAGVFTGVAARLEPDGLFVLSLELGTCAPYRLNDNGRYSHHPDAVRELAARCGLDVMRLDEGYLRMEYGEAVRGLFVALRPSHT